MKIVSMSDLKIFFGGGEGDIGVFVVPYSHSTQESQNNSVTKLYCG